MSLITIILLFMCYLYVLSLLVVPPTSQFKNIKSINKTIVYNMPKTQSNEIYLVLPTLFSERSLVPITSQLKRLNKEYIIVNWEYNKNVNGEYEELDHDYLLNVLSSITSQLADRKIHFICQDYTILLPYWFIRNENPANYGDVYHYDNRKFNFVDKIMAYWFDTLIDYGEDLSSQEVDLVTAMVYEKAKIDYDLIKSYKKIRGLNLLF